MDQTVQQALHELGSQFLNHAKNSKRVFGLIGNEYKEKIIKLANKLKTIQVDEEFTDIITSLGNADSTINEMIMNQIEGLVTKEATLFNTLNILFMNTHDIHNRQGRREVQGGREGK